MQVRVKAVFDSIKKEIKCCNNPTPYLGMADGLLKFISHGEKGAPVVEFTRDLANTLIYSSQELIVWLVKQGEQMLKLFQILLTAMFTDIYKVGRCKEFAYSGLIGLLKAGIKDTIEIVAFDGKSTFSHQLVNHAFLIIGRDLKTDIGVPPSWGRVKKFDPWGNDKIMDEIHFSTRESLGVGAFYDLKKIQVDATWSGGLRPEDCDLIISFLDKIKDACTVPLVDKALLKSGRDRAGAKAEQAVIFQKINEEIECFKAFKKSSPLAPGAFMVKHYDLPVRYYMGMFRKKDPSLAQHNDHDPVLVIKNEAFKL